MIKIFMPFIVFFKAIYRFIDKIIVTPISRAIYYLSKKLKSNTSHIEKILNRPNILVYLSLVFAVVVFVLVDKKVITLVETEAEVLTNQPVNVLYNKEAYVVEGLVDTVDIILTGRKSDLYLAKQLGDHEVLLDLTDYEASNEPYKVKLTYNQTIDSLDYKIDPSTVTVTIKNKVSSLSGVTYDLLNENKLNSKLSVGDVSLSKSEVVVKGSQDNLDRIATVKALIDLNNGDLKDAGSYDIDNVLLVAYDEKGKMMSNIDIVPSTVTATIELNTYSSSVPIAVKTKGNLATGKAISSITINGSNTHSVDVYGEQSVIDSIKNVPVSIDVSGLGASDSKTYNVTLPKPSGVRYMSDSTAKIVVSFGDEKQRTIEHVLIGAPKNLASGLTVNAKTENDQSVDVVVKGVQSVIDSVSADDIVPYIDLSGYTAGEHEVEVLVENDDPRIEYIVTKKINVVIK
ncbi:MAG: hypothetical protein E7158_06200 [Firmicutes bacterium]|nr:hypothetical protein [Bacillota bacterium]